MWVKTLRETKKEFLRLSIEIYDDGPNDKYILNEEIAPSYIDACLAIGNYREAQGIAKKLGRAEIVLKVNNALPKEILDLPFLRKYINDNFPESTFGRGNS